MGIIPGQTTWNEALAILRSRVFSSDGVSVILDKPSKISRVSLSISNPINSIKIEYLKVSLITLGEVVAMYGSPCKVSWYNGDIRITISYPLLAVVIKTDVWPSEVVMERQLPIRQITLYSPSPSACKNGIVATRGLGISMRTRGGPWPGFNVSPSAASSKCEGVTSKIC
jgi:hypothetical protein